MKKKKILHKILDINILKDILIFVPIKVTNKKVNFLNINKQEISQKF